MTATDSSRREQRRKQQNELSRTHILDAAEEVFGGKGFHEATIKEIADLAEFSVGGVYGFFENKDVLFIEVMARHGDVFVPAMEAIVKGEDPPESRLADLAAFQVRYFRENPDFGRLLLRSTGAPVFTISASLRESMTERYERAMGLIAALMAEGIAAESFHAGDPRVLAQIFSGIIQAYQLTDPQVLATAAADKEYPVEELQALIHRAFVI